jgi:hypothetical protein
MCDAELSPQIQYCPIQIVFSTGDISEMYNKNCCVFPVMWSGIYLRCTYSRGYIDIGCPVIKVSSSQRIQYPNQGSTNPHLRSGTDPVSETLCFLQYRTMDEVQKPSNPEGSQFYFGVKKGIRAYQVNTNQH